MFLLVFLHRIQPIYCIWGTSIQNHILGWTRIHTHEYMLEPIPLSAIRTITSMHCNVRRGIGAQMMRVVNYAHFALNIGSVSILIWYDVLLMIMYLPIRLTHVWLNLIIVWTSPIVIVYTHNRDTHCKVLDHWESLSLSHVVHEKCYITLHLMSSLLAIVAL